MVRRHPREGGTLAKVALALLSTAALAGTAATGNPPQHRTAAAVDPALLLRARIAAAYAAPSLTVTDYPAAPLRRMIRTRIAPALLAGAQAIRGTDFRFTPADGNPRHAGLITLRYATPALAADRAKPLLGDRRAFRRAKILTPMVAAARGDTIAIFFTESAGDTKLRAALAKAAAHFGAS